ncbi:MAG: thiamine pyrophosphate-dependent dehydrogenase E1 component subunit alpha, partial [Candidatus Bathyarchaeia archaeon]
MSLFAAVVQHAPALTVGPVEESMLQVIREDGFCDTLLEPELNVEQRLYLYELMVLVRRFDEKALLLQRMGRTTLHGPCVGQEACHVGSGSALAAEDWVFPYFREPGILIMRGMPLKTIFAHLLGNTADLCKGHNMPCQWANSQLNIAAPSGPIDAKLPVAVGVSLAMKLKGVKHVTLLYMGDGATSQPAFHAAMNFAGVYRTPIVFLCQNNQYAISTPVHKQTASATLAVKASAYGFEGIRVDGNDVLAMYSATKRA